MPLNEATKLNLQRKSAYVDVVQMHEGIPLFSWIDLSLTELCNRSAGAKNACVFCPRIDKTFYPNQNLHMSLELVHRMGAELEALGYRGTIVLCGYGEPLLHPDLLSLVQVLRASARLARIEVVTNGDTLGPKKAEDLIQAGVDYFVVSMYDGPHQVEKFHSVFREIGREEGYYLLRDRWHTAADQFGLKLTNRGGTVSVGPQEVVDTHRPCYYLAYQMQIDWNGDVLLCPQDWHKKLKFGNVGAQGLFEIWSSPRMQKRRKQLLLGRREEHPCHECNTDGTLHGFNHVPAWGVKP